MSLSVCAHGGAGVCGCGAGAQCVHCLPVRGPAPPQRQPTGGRGKQMDLKNEFVVSCKCKMWKIRSEADTCGS